MNIVKLFAQQRVFRIQYFGYFFTIMLILLLGCGPSAADMDDIMKVIKEKREKLSSSEKLSQQIKAGEYRIAEALLLTEYAILSSSGADRDFRLDSFRSMYTKEKENIIKSNDLLKRELSPELYKKLMKIRKSLGYADLFE